MKGAKRRVRLASGKRLDITIPAGVRDGQQILLKGQGEPSPFGGPPGDALIEVVIKPHRHFRREGNNILLEVPISLPEALGGAKITVPTIDGPVSLSVPAGANSGTRLRLKGKGAPKTSGKASGGRGDQYVTLTVMLPTTPDPELAAFVKRRAADHDYSVKRDFSDL